MRLKPGRPDIATYADRFDVPGAGDDFSVTFLGVATVLLDDGHTAVMTDGYFSRPGLLRVLARPLAPDHPRIDGALRRLGFGPGARSLAAVAPVHTHFDHALDSAEVAGRTGAVLVGGESTANVGRGGGLGPDSISLVVPGEPRTFGGFTLTHVVSSHCPPDRFPGDVTEPVVPPARAATYRCGEAWSILVEHSSGRTALLQGSAGYVEGALLGRHADVAYLGVGQLGVMPEDYIRTYWAETVEAVGARRVVLTHWDDFFRGLDRPLRALPFAGDDLHVTMRVLTALATEQGVHLHLPTVWRREDPWSGL
ncbi:MBL fold metallo-hydrolase [Nocardioides sp. Soil777]|uniref:MBL fold metallo-hydrolase n=1 Tax=Nocardioides sp. Soil777 TaxID=1736409 RepID=UPI0007039E70|nr:MBL fold metallo-hydrolase [Nocardioides sp. Soil777]KRE99336.1 MBL fold metallo-hydrolase [Nocardioides sp. Soil777]